MGTPRFRGDARALPILIVAMLILASLGISPAAARQPAGAPALELPALSLTPPQLAAAGMPGYALTGGEMSGPSALAYITGKWTDQISNDRIQESFESFGLRRAYEAGLRSRQDPADIRSDLARDLEVSLHEFGDANGARQALGSMDELSAAFPEVQRVQGTGPVTAGAVLVGIPIEEPDDARQLWVAWQVDRLIVVVGILDYMQAEPTAEDAEAIAAAFTQGIQAGLTGSTPGLGNMALRLANPEFASPYEIRSDEYWRMGGEDFARGLEEPDVLARRLAASGDALDVYAFNQFIQGSESVEPSLPHQFGWITRLYRFADDQAASAWLAAQVGQIETSYAGTGVLVRDLQTIADAPVVGDESVSVTYIEQDDFPGTISRTFMRVGNRTADVFLTTFVDDPFPDTTIRSLSALQAQCLTGGCPDLVMITDAVAGTLSVNTPVSGTAVPGASTSFDLALLTLTPADLAALQMPGYGVGFGQMSYPEAFIASTAQNRGLPEDQVRTAVEGSGFVRRYDSQLYLPADPGVPAGPVGRIVASYVLEFADAPGAASVFGFLEDESGNAQAGDIPLSAPIGDQSEATHEASTDPNTGETFDQIDVTFQAGRFQAGVAIIDWQGQTVQLAEVETAARQLLTRVQAPPTGAAGLSGVALRISGDQVQPYMDQYRLSAGVAVPQYGELAQDIQARSSAAASIAQSDEYAVEQFLAGGASVPENGTWYRLWIMRFTDETAATNWVAGVSGRLNADPSFSNVVVLQGPAVGDQSVAYTLTTTDGTSAYRGIVFRVGNQVASIDLSGPTIASPLLLLAIADRQATCLADGICTAPYAVPASLG